MEALDAFEEKRRAARPARLCRAADAADDDANGSLYRSGADDGSGNDLDPAIEGEGTAFHASEQKKQEAYALIEQSEKDMEFLRANLEKADLAKQHEEWQPFLKASIVNF